MNDAEFLAKLSDVVEGLDTLLREDGQRIAGFFRSHERFSIINIHGQLRTMHFARAGRVEPPPVPNVYGVKR